MKARELNESESVELSQSVEASERAYHVESHPAHCESDESDDPGQCDVGSLGVGEHGRGGNVSLDDGIHSVVWIELGRPLIESL